MAVLGVTVEANGWVLAVRGDWPATTGAWNFGGDRPDREWRSGGVDQFPLDPGGTPKIEVNLTEPGFDRVGAEAVANPARARKVFGTRPLRRPWPTQGQLDETDNGDGTRTVRIALSDRVYATSTIVSVNFLAGWRVGEPATVLAPAVNASTRSFEVPIFRWANEPWGLVQGSVGAPNHRVRVELIVATHYPEHFGPLLNQACASLRLRVFDNTTFTDFWVPTPSSSPLYADGLRCWTVELDLEGRGLNPGPLTVHATVFPWRGAERSTGTAHNTDINAALQSGFGAPFHFYYDPTGSTITRRYLMIDNTSPNTDPANAAHRAATTLYTDLASALAAPLANKAANIQVAQAALGALNVSWPSRNGFFGPVARFSGWSEFILTANQVHTPGTVSFGGAGAQAYLGYIVIRGDPTNANPRANCVLQSSGTAVQFGNTNRIKLRDLTVRFGNTSILTSPTANRWATFENVTVDGVTGQESGGGELLTSLNHFSAFNCIMRNTNAQPLGWFQRNVIRTRANNTGATACMINVTIPPAAAGEFNPGRTVQAFAGGSSNVNDLMLWGCKVYAWQSSFIGAQGAVNFGENVFSTRWAIVNCLFELATDSANKIFTAIGESGGSALRDSIFEAATIVGGRFNWHNDAPFISTTGNLAAVRVNNSPTTTIRVGVIAHGLAVGDSITVAGFANSNMNRTTTVTAVPNANQFEYAAAAAVTTTGSATNTRQSVTAAGDTQGGPRVTINSGGQTGVTRFIGGHPNIQSGNVMRYCAIDRNATKHDVFDRDPTLTQSWELLYGVGFRGNVNANRGTSSPESFQYAFYGIGSETELNFTGPPASPVASYGVNWAGFMADLSANGPGEPGGVGSGDYRADIGTDAVVANGTTTVQLGLTLHGLVNGQSVTLAGFAPAALNGTWTVTVVNANAFTITVGSAVSAITVFGTVTLPGSVIRTPNPNFKPSRLLGKGNGPAVIDRDGDNKVRGEGFTAGALGALNAATSLIPNLLVHTNIGGEPAVAPGSGVFAASLSHGHVIGAGALGTGTALAAAGMVHSHLVAVPSVSTGTLLTALGLAHGHSLAASSLSVAGATSLAPNTLAHGLTLSAASIASTGSSTVTPLGLSHAQLLSTVLLPTGTQMAPAPMVHSHPFAPAAMVVIPALVPGKMNHGLLLGGGTLGVPASGGLPPARSLRVKGVWRDWKADARWRVA